MQLTKLKTEKRNRASTNLDAMSAIKIATLMNRQDAMVPRAIRRVLPQVARAIDLIARQLAHGGRLIYVGAGTSGRIGALDAAEIPPTYGMPPGVIQFVMAGGERALAAATEADEDSSQVGQCDIAARSPKKSDVVVAIATSGLTSNTIGALRHARKKAQRPSRLFATMGRSWPAWLRSQSRSMWAPRS